MQKIKTAVLALTLTAAATAASAQGLALIGVTNQTCRYFTNGTDPGATSNSFTIANTRVSDAGVYHAQLANLCGTVDSRSAVLTVSPLDGAPVFLLAHIVGPGWNTFRLTTDRELCADAAGTTCATDYRLAYNWQIVQADDPAVDLAVALVVMINPTTYEFTTELPRLPNKRYRIRVSQSGEISDLSGNRVLPGTFVETAFTLTFQQGDVNGYAGTHDAEIHSNALADTPLGALTPMRMDLDDFGISQGLLRFEGLFGHGTNQVTPSADILCATLALYQIDPGSAVNLHRMLVPWDEGTVTWNSLLFGVFPNTGEAVILADATIAASHLDGWVYIDVTSSLRAWSDGQPNFGWAFLSTGPDGFAVNTSESTNGRAPFLSVAFSGGDPCLPSQFVQPPATLGVLEDQPFSIAVGVSNAFALDFQWTKNGADIAGATGSVYTVAFATRLDAGTYRLRVSCASNPNLFTLTSPTVVTIENPPSRPYLTAAVPQLDGVTITLRFSERLHPVPAQSTANYTFLPPLAVMGATLSNETSSATVQLTTAPRALSQTYVLSIANLLNNLSTPSLIDPNPTLVNLTGASLILPWNADGWLYNTNNLDGTPDWKNLGFTPGPDWHTGIALFGLESSASVRAAAPAPINTPLAANSVVPGDQLTTAYFRRRLHLPDLPAGARYVIGHYVDDGFIAYLDGAEIYRFAMPGGAVTFTNRSTGIPTGEATYRYFTFDATAGLHTLAVELHQAGTTSADVLFGMEVRMVDATSPALSIARAISGDVTLSWSADNSWRLRGAAAAPGPYLDVAIPSGAPLGTFFAPHASVTNTHRFFLLDYIGGP
jgi:hypothetical protein